MTKPKKLPRSRAVPRTEKEALYFTLAKQRVIEGDIEVDDDAVVSISDGGAYVQAWIWVE
ncbi:MAG: hypothetical protein ACRD4C_08090 [Candidatus Acidiferrales bacterium]